MSEIEIVHISHDEASIQAYVERYKALRLLSLQVAPEMFGSTYAREVAFSDETWLDRLANPQATTYAALQGDNMVGSITILGPLPFHPENEFLSNPWEPRKDEHEQDAPDYAHFRINGVFTSPSVRGKGVGKSLMEVSLKGQKQMAADLGKELVSTIGVDSDNIPAVNLYRKFGYVTIKEAPRPGDSSRTGLLLKFVEATT